MLTTNHVRMYIDTLDISALNSKQPFDRGGRALAKLLAVYGGDFGDADLRDHAPVALRLQDLAADQLIVDHACTA